MIDFNNPENVFALATSIKRPCHEIESVIDSYETRRYITERQARFLYAAICKHHPTEIARATNIAPLRLDARPPQLELKDVPGLRIPLYPYQLYGANFIDFCGGNAVVADEMGLGKTAQAIAYFHGFLPDSAKIIIICPATVKEQWRNEIMKWTGIEALDIDVLEGETPYRTNGRIKIINYDILFKNSRKNGKAGGREWADALAAGAPDLVVCDEGHFLKSGQSRRYKAVSRIRDAAPRLLILTGTPIENRPIEFYTLTKLVRPEMWPSKRWYQRRYCGLKRGKYTRWDDSGATNTFELHQELTAGDDAIMVRRKTRDVLPDLPAVRRVMVPLELDNRDEYNKIKTELVNWIKETFPDEEHRIAGAETAEALVRFEYLKQCVAKGKLNSAISWVKDWLEGEPKMVCFFTHTEPLRAFAAAFGSSAAVIDGSTPAKDREAIAERFRTDESLRILAGNLKAAGTGLNLQTAHATAHIEFAWSPGLHDQGEARVARIGQKRDSVLAYYLMARGTVDERLVHLLDEKRRIVKAALDGQRAKDSDLLATLMRDLITCA